MVPGGLCFESSRTFPKPYYGVQASPSVLFVCAQLSLRLIYIYIYTLSCILFVYFRSRLSVHTSAIMQLPPAEVLLAWPLPNYSDPVTRGDAVLIVNIITIIIAFLMTCLRLYTRLRITCTPGLDDIVIIISLVGLHLYGSINPVISFNI